MATRTVFDDGNGNELECYLNRALQVYISVGPRDDWQSVASIVLDREDVRTLIEILLDAKRTMDAEAEAESEAEAEALDTQSIPASSDSLN